MFMAPGQYTVSLTCTDENDVTYTNTDTVDVFYVRRELRMLTDTDRDRYLDTFKMMSKIKSSTGREL